MNSSLQNSTITEDEKWMEFALHEALKAENEGEVPVGAIIVKNNKIIAKGFNQTIQMHDACAHAEVEAIRQAGKNNNNHRLVGSTLYVTLEPCLMCFGAIIQARIDRIVFGAYDPKSSTCSFFQSNKNYLGLNHQLLISSGVLEKQSSSILKNFFKLKR